jgi:small subunit ribosomal protein S2
MTKIENLPVFTIQQLLEAGVHFGHKTMRRNPKMLPYIHTERKNISIIDLSKTANMLHKSMAVVKEIAKNNGRILFVATKRQAADIVAIEAKRCGQYYVNERWLGGMLTNWKTVSQSIKTLKKVEEQLADEEIGFKKKEKLMLERKRQKLELALGGIKNIAGYPDLIFAIDIYKESLAVAEAKKLGIPIMAIVDTNTNPDPITYKIPGNDDSVKAIKLYCRLISDSIIAGIKENMLISGVDVQKFEAKSGDLDVAGMKSAIEDAKEVKTERKPFNKREGKFEDKKREGKFDDKKGFRGKRDGAKPSIRSGDFKKSFPSKKEKPAFSDQKAVVKKPAKENKSENISE